MGVECSKCAKAPPDGKEAEWVQSAPPIEAYEGDSRGRFESPGMNFCSLTLKEPDPLKDARQLKDLPKWDLQLVHDEFGRIASFVTEGECRAVTLGQLRRVWNFAREHSRNWISVGQEGPWEPESEQLAAERLNFYTLNEWLILPATRDLESTERQDCSMMELLANRAQSGGWFVSHWWGASVQALARGCEVHAQARGPAPSEDEVQTVNYWVAAYSLRQHQWREDRVEEQALVKALQLSTGTLLVLDDKGVAFSRLWCNYELIKTAEDGVRKRLLDLVAEVPGDAKSGASPAPALLVDGALDGEDASQRVLRESRFPIALLSTGLRARLEHCVTADPVDRVRLLNRIQGFSGEDLDNTDVIDRLETDSAFYTHCVARLRSQLAVMAWPLVLLSRQSGSGPRAAKPEISTARSLPEGVLSLPELLKADAGRTSVVLDLSHLGTFGSEDYGDLCAGLPSQLQTLEVSAAGPVDDSSTQALAAALRGLPGLRCLTLMFTSPPRRGQGLVALAQAFPGDLEVLRLSCAGGGEDGFAIEDVKALAAGVSQLKGLRELDLALGELICGTEASVRPVATAVRTLPRLERLDLVIGELHLTSLEEVRQGTDCLLMPSNGTAGTQEANFRSPSPGPGAKIDYTAIESKVPRISPEKIDLQVLMDVCLTAGCQYALFWEPDASLRCHDVSGALVAKLYFDFPEVMSEYCSALPSACSFASPARTAGRAAQDSPAPTEGCPSPSVSTELTDRGLRESPKGFVEGPGFAAESSQSVFVSPSGGPNLSRAVLLSIEPPAGGSVLPLANFSRKDIAAKYGVRSVALVPCAGGILEYGAGAEWRGFTA